MGQGSIRIRDAGPNDAGALASLHRRSSELWDDDRALLAAYPDLLEPPDRAIAEGRVRVAIDPEGRHLGFSTVLALDAGRCELDDLFVDPDAMGRGVGRALVEDVVARASSAGATGIDVIANPRAVGFYTRLGFRVTGKAATRFASAPRMSRDLDANRLPMVDAQTTRYSRRMTGPVKPAVPAPNPIDRGARIGHVHLRTADIDRVRGFYVDVLGFDVVFEARDVPGWGTTGDMLFVSAGGYHHHLGFNTWKSAGGPPQPDGVAGLHHVAIVYPTRAGLADAVRRLQAIDWPLRQLADHGTHEAVYVSDPDGNDLELYWDRPERDWPLDAEGRLAFSGGELDLADLLAEH